MPQEVTRVTGPRGAVWIVDYDIPAKPIYQRRQFYRARTRLFQEYRIWGHRSTDSVLICNHEHLARALFSLACQYGEAHLYRGVEVAGGKSWPSHV
jgi:hypothetical protein